MENISIKIDHRIISGVLHRPQTPTDRTLIISHGFRGSKDGGGRAIAVATEAASAGFNVLRYDFTPLQSLSCQFFELNKVVTYVRNSLGNTIFLLGRSMGGSASILAADQDRKISGLILWATPYDLTSTFRLALGPHYQRLEKGENLFLTDEYGTLFLTPEFIRDFAKYDLLSCIRRLSATPLLILHGAKDNIVPIDQAFTIYNSAGGLKRIVQFPGADHHLSAHSHRAAKVITKWLQSLC